MKWTHSKNGHQEYYSAGIGLEVYRNLGEHHWVIYDLRQDTVSMIPNPNPSSQTLSFVATDEGGGEPLCSPNYAWDNPQQAVQYAEQIHSRENALIIA